MNVAPTIHVKDLSVTVSEKKRRRALDALEILDTPPEPEIDFQVAPASEICGTPMRLISLIDSELQWCKVAVGLAVSETPVALSICAYAISEKGLFVVEDATRTNALNRILLFSVVLTSASMQVCPYMPVTA